MLNDADTNFVYFSSLLSSREKYENTCSELTSILEKHHLGFGFLPGTSTIWCRDYMPIQAATDRFVEYRYGQDYQEADKWKHLRTDPGKVCEQIGIHTIRTDLRLEGGHVLRSGKRVMLADKILAENPSHSPALIKSMLEEYFRVDEVILFPWNRSLDFFGHMDGLIRFIDDDRVMLNGYLEKFDPYLFSLACKTLEYNKLETTLLRIGVQEENRALNWAYANFLRLKDLIIIPTFGMDEDEQVIEQYRRIFPDYSTAGRIETIDATAIVSDGGGLDCITWNICL